MWLRVVPIFSRMTSREIWLLRKKQSRFASTTSSQHVRPHTVRASSSTQGPHSHDCRCVAQGLAALYAANGVALLAAYIPQARSVWRSTAGAVDVSLLTWCLWSIASFVAALYAHFVDCDLEYFLLSLCNAAGCSVIAGLVAVKRMNTRSRVRL